MLAQNFKAADDLGITEPQRSALMKVLVLLETGKLVYAPEDEWGNEGGVCWGSDLAYSGHFNMSTFGDLHPCGTVACIGGTAQLVGNVKFCVTQRPAALQELFYAGSINTQLSLITPDQAATALRSYLTTGDARWDLAVTTG